MLGTKIIATLVIAAMAWASWPAPLGNRSVAKPRPAEAWATKSCISCFMGAGIVGGKD